MAVPSMSTFYAGQRLRAADMNSQVRDAVNWAISAKVCRVQRPSSQTIATGGEAIQFPSEDFDPLAWHNGSTLTNLIVPNIEGYYQVHACTSFVASASGTIRRAIIQAKSYNSGPYDMAGASALPHASVRPLLSVSTIVYLNGTTDYVQLFAYQDTGSNLNTSVADGTTTSLCVSLLGTA